MYGFGILVHTGAYTDSSVLDDAGVSCAASALRVRGGSALGEVEGVLLGEDVGHDDRDGVRVGEELWHGDRDGVRVGEELGHGECVGVALGDGMATVGDVGGSTDGLGVELELATTDAGIADAELLGVDEGEDDGEGEVVGV